MNYDHKEKRGKNIDCSIFYIRPCWWRRYYHLFFPIHLGRRHRRMDALTTSVSSFTLAGPASHYSTSRELYYHSNTRKNYHSHSNPCKPRPSISNKSTGNSNNRDFAALQFPSSPKKSSNFKLSTTTFHRKAASGYAAALVDVARSNNSIEAVAKDVRKLSKWLGDDNLRDFLLDPLTEEIEKGQVLIELAEKGKLNRNLVAILKLLVKKNKSGLVNDVMLEFKRIYDELTGTCHVLLLSSSSSSSDEKMDKNKLFGIAKGVQKLSGALKVKISHAFDQTLPPLAT